MSLTKETFVDQITVDRAANISVRTATRVMDDGVPIGSDTYHRVVHAPGTDLTSADPRVIAIAAVVWTPAVVAAYRAERSAARALRPTLSHTSANA